MRGRTSGLTVLLSALLGLGALATAHAEPPRLAAGSLHAFVGCPIYRDTDKGRKSGCWLADDPASARRFDITWAPIKPQLGREVLVEGVVTDEPDECGGVVLKPVRVAVLKGTCPSVKLAAGPYAGRPSPPATEVLAPTSVPRVLPPPPFVTKRFDIYFEFGRDFLMYQHAEVAIERALLYARASQAKRVHIEGYAATEPLAVSGRTLSEPLPLAEARAKMVAEALRRLGLPEESLVVTARGAPSPDALEGGRLPEPSKRRVTIVVIP